MRAVLLALGVAGGLTAQTLIPGAGSGGGSGGSGGSGSGKVLLSESTASASASLDFDTVFSDNTTYDRFEIELAGVLPATDGAQLTANLRSGGSYATADYDGRVFCALSNGTTDDQVTTTTALNVVGCDAANTGVGNDSFSGIEGSYYIADPDSTSRYTMLRGESVYQNNPASAGLERGSWSEAHGIWRQTAAVQGIRFQFSSGNIASGTIRVWGLPAE